MHDDESVLKTPEEPMEERSGVSRRDFLKISTIAAAVPVVSWPKMVLAAGEHTWPTGRPSTCRLSKSRADPAAPKRRPGPAKRK